MTIAKLDPMFQLYIDCVAYDSTPLFLVDRGDRPADMSGNMVDIKQNQALEPPGADLGHLGAGTALAQRRSSATEAQTALHILQPGGILLPSGAERIAIASSAVCGFRVMSSGAASCILEAQRRTRGASRASTAFRQIMRIACTGWASANIAASRVLP